MKKIRIFLIILGTIFLMFLIEHEAKSEVIKTKKDILCSPLSEMEQAVSQWGENEVWTGFSPKENTLYTFFYNLEKKTWSIIQYDKSTACIIGYGEGETPKSENKTQGK